MLKNEMALESLVQFNILDNNYIKHRNLFIVLYKITKGPQI